MTLAVVLNGNLRHHLHRPQVIAMWIGVLTFFHILFHFFNYAAAPDVRFPCVALLYQARFIAEFTCRTHVPSQFTIAVFPSPIKPPWYGKVTYAPWYTGAFATMAMFFIYTAASRA